MSDLRKLMHDYEFGELFKHFRDAMRDTLHDPSNDWLEQQAEVAFLELLAYAVQPKRGTADE